ncbi:hypothetical protein AAC387_Pa03g3287 [Persea americana]
MTRNLGMDRIIQTFVSTNSCKLLCKSRLLKMSSREHVRLNKLQRNSEKGEERAPKRAQADRDRAAFQAQILALTNKAAQPVQVVMPPREVDPNDLYEKFRKRVPPEFHRFEDPMVANDFIKQMEQIFAVFRCTQKQQVNLASYKFRGIALQWWNSVKAVVQAEAVTKENAWETFTKEFMDKFIPKYVKDQWQRDFQNLCKVTGQCSSMNSSSQD